MQIKSDSLQSSAEISRALYQSYYPNGQMLVKNTSYSTEGVQTRTLTTRTVSDALSGDALYRNPKYSLTFYNKSIGSSLNSLVTGGSESVFGSPASLKIFNPESTTVDEEGKRTSISGGIAFNRIVADTVLGKRAGEGFIDRGSQIAIADISNGEKLTEYTERVGGMPHGNTEYETDSAMISSGSRAIALKNQLSSEEIGWILERGKLLKETSTVNDSSILISGFTFDIPDSLTDLNQTPSYYPGVEKSQKVDSSTIGAPSQSAYIAPALIELLLYLSSKLKIRGGTGAQRAAQPENMGTNNSTLTNGSSITDHAFGRAFDIMSIETLPGAASAVKVNFGTEGANVSKYRTGLDTFLKALNTAPATLLPDLIVVNPDLDSELGITSGLESEDATIKKQYPNLKYVNFHSDSNHKSHIHISFSASRSGQYSGPGGALGTAGSYSIRVPGSGSNNLIGAIGQGNVPVLSEKFRRNFAETPNESLTRQEVFDLLRATVMSDEAAAIFVAVAARESGLKPYSFNPNTNSGDWSVGLFQMNMLTTAHGKKMYVMPVGGGSASRKGWQLAYKSWQSAGVDEANFNKKCAAAYKSLGKSGCFPLVDPIVWVPINQAYMAYTVASGGVPTANMPSEQKLGAVAESGYIFSGWGDYGGGPPYGFISSVKFKDAVEVYKTCGKNPVLLKRWTLTMFAGNGQKSDSAKYANNWVEGYVYPVDFNGTWIAKSPIPPTEDLYAGYPADGSGGTGSSAGSGAGSGAYSGTGTLESAIRWAESQIGAPYAAINPYRIGAPAWPGGSLTGFRNNTYNFPAGTSVYDCSGFVVAAWKKVGIDFIKEYGIFSSQQFNTSRIPDAPSTALKPMDIVVYRPSFSGVGHVVLVHSIDPDGTVKTIEATPSKGVSIKTLDLNRASAYKRPVPYIQNPQNNRS